MKNLCCSQFFQKNSPINQPESLIYEYKMYSFPFSKSNKDNILKTIVGFLNNQGGFLFIGIKETPNKERFAVGLTLTGRQKESLHQSIRSMVQNISPATIQYQSKVLISQIPMKIGTSFIRGQYVIKITVLKGNSNELYYCRLNNSKKRHYYYRNHDETITIQPSKVQALKNYRKIMENTGTYLQTHKCLEPQIATPFQSNQNLDLFQDEEAHTISQLSMVSDQISVKIVPQKKCHKPSPVKEERQIQNKSSNENFQDGCCFLSLILIVALIVFYYCF